MKKITQAIILAGGLGRRLMPLTATVPKPMIEIHGKPFLEYILIQLKKNDIKEVVILTGYLHENIENYFKDGSAFNLSITYSKSLVEDDTGTRIRKAKHLVHENFLLLYADNYWPLQLKDLSKIYFKNKTLGLMTVYANKDAYTKNNIVVNDRGYVEVYDKEGKHPGLNSVDIGFFILNKKVVDLLPIKNCSFEKLVIPELIKTKQLFGFLTNHKYYGLSNLNRIPSILEFFKEKKIVFLDRDGVINKKAPKAEYITKWKDFIFLPNVKKALKLLNKKGYTIFIVTNQPGISRNMLTPKKLELIHKNFLKKTEKIGINIQEIFVCTHGWNDGCFCRKPNPGMFFQAAQKYHFDLYKSYCIGDDERDIIAGLQAGCKTFLINKKNDLYTIVYKYL